MLPIFTIKDTLAGQLPTCDAYWHVLDMMSFENIGFTKEQGPLRYLCCADCEAGPLGFAENEHFYISIDRVKYSLI